MARLHVPASSPLRGQRFHHHQERWFKSQEAPTFLPDLGAPSCPFRPFAAPGPGGRARALGSRAEDVCERAPRRPGCHSIPWTPLGDCRTGMEFGKAYSAEAFIAFPSSVYRTAHAEAAWRGARSTPGIPPVPRRAVRTVPAVLGRTKAAFPLRRPSWAALGLFHPGRGGVCRPAVVRVPPLSHVCTFTRTQGATERSRPSVCGYLSRLVAAARESNAR